MGEAKHEIKERRTLAVAPNAGLVTLARRGMVAGETREIQLDGVGNRQILRRSNIRQTTACCGGGDGVKEWRDEGIKYEDEQLVGSPLALTSEFFAE